LESGCRAGFLKSHPLPPLFEEKRGGEDEDVNYLRITIIKAKVS
jgi:hypothetical protein